jgi:nitrite reductase (NO-forming)
MTRPIVPVTIGSAPRISSRHWKYGTDGFGVGGGRTDMADESQPAGSQKTQSQKAESQQSQRGDGAFAVLSITAVAAVLALAVSIVAMAIAGASGDGGGSSGSGESAATGETQTIEVELGEFYVDPASIEVPAGTEVIVQVTNAGSMAHDLMLNGETGTEMIEPGETAEASLGVIDAESQAWCTVPGHKEAGMVMTITVTGGGGGGATGEHGATDGGGSDSTGATIDFEAEPPADFQPYDPNLAPAPGGTEHTLTVHAAETVMEVAPGVTQEMWTFNGTVPGPALRGRVGDIFTITLVNDGTLGHSIDFHASKVAWNDEMRTIEPGESLVYQFEAKHAGMFMYHCGTPPALHHIGNGMYGALIVDPPVLAPVDHEYAFVQSELYLGPEGQPGDLGSMQTVDFDAVVFNGYVNQYQYHPIRVEPGERIRIWVLDAGPNENSAFHIVGTIFDTVFKEGTYLLQPDARRGGAQALDLQPSQGGFVEFTFDEAGLYLFVTHKFANVGKGALGVFQAGEVADATAEH